MKWEYIFSSVLIFYLKGFAVFMAYFFTKTYTAQNRSSTTPNLTERLFRYAVCVAAVIAISFLSAAGYAIPADTDSGHTFTKADISEIKKEQEEREPIQANRGAIVFLVLIIPTLIGATEGFNTKTEHHPSHSDYDWNG